MSVARCVSVRAAARTTTNTPAAGRTLKALNITKQTLVESNGGRAVRNVDSAIYEIIYAPASDSVKVLCKGERVEYEAEIGKDNRISIILETAQPLAGGPPSFQDLQSVLKFDGPGPEAINGRAAMLAVLGTAVAEVATGRTLLEQAGSPGGAAAALALMAAVTAASLAPLLLGKVRVTGAFPDPNDSYPDQQLPYLWGPLAETINGRVAMIGLLGLLINEAIRGAPVF